MFVEDAIGDHIVEAYSSIGLLMTFHVASIIFLCKPHLVGEMIFN